MTRPKEASVRAWGLALVLLLMVLMASGRAEADPSDEALLLTQLNAARVQNRVAALGRSADLDAIARRHAARIAGAPHPFHNANLRAETPGWLAIGEVVGRVDGGPGWEARLQQLFLSSPTHRRVSLGTNFTVVGIGTVRTAANVVNAVEVFGRASGSRPARPPRAARAAAAPVDRQPAPRPTTTVPPTTTTTQPLSRLALAPLPDGPQTTAPAVLARAVPRRSGAAPALGAMAAAAELTALGVLVSVASANRSRRAGRRRPAC